MTEQKIVLKKHMFVKITSVEGEIERWRVAQVEKLRESLEIAVLQTNDFIFKHLSTNEACLAWLKGGQPLCRGFKLDDTSNYLKVLLANIGRIVQIYDDPIREDDGSQTASVCLELTSNMCLNTATMYLEEVDPSIIQVYGRFYMDQRVRISDPGGILYPLNNKIASENYFYPVQPEVTGAEKQKIFAKLAGKVGMVWMSEPTEKRVLVIVNLCGSGETVVYVRPEFLEIA